MEMIDVTAKEVFYITKEITDDAGISKYQMEIMGFEQDFNTKSFYFTGNYQHRPFGIIHIPEKNE